MNFEEYEYAIQVYITSYWEFVGSFSNYYWAIKHLKGLRKMYSDHQYRLVVRTLSKWEEIETKETTNEN